MTTLHAGLCSVVTQPSATCYQNETQLEKRVPRKDPLRNPLIVVMRKNQNAMLQMHFLTPQATRSSSGLPTTCWERLTCSADLRRLLHLHLFNNQHRGPHFQAFDVRHEAVCLQAQTRKLVGNNRGITFFKCPRIVYAPRQQTIQRLSRPFVAVMQNNFKTRTDEPKSGVGMKNDAAR